jgi:hypothetical protein
VSSKAAILTFITPMANPVISAGHFFAGNSQTRPQKSFGRLPQSHGFSLPQTTLQAKY